MDHPQQPQSLPLLFSFREVVFGNGFVAVVKMDGKVLLETETVGDQEEFWLTGICPVGISGGGSDRGAAFSEFRNVWKSAVFDIAANSSNFSEFKTECEKFLGASQDSITKLWDDALKFVRSSSYEDDKLPKGSAERPVRWDISDVTDFASRKNEVEPDLKVAA